MKRYKMLFMLRIHQIIISPLLVAFSCSQTKTNDNISQQTKEYKETVIYSYEYNCLTITERCGLDILKLINRDTLIYISSEESDNRYEETRGKLIQINDSLYYVKCYKHIFYDSFKDFGYNKDSLLFVCGNELINHKITIEYQNKEKESYKIYAQQNRFLINKNYFNDTNNKIKVDIEYPHPIVDENVMQFGSYGGGIGLVPSSYNNDFYVIIDSTRIQSINIATESYSFKGPRFNLKRFPTNGTFSRGRKLR